MQKFYLDVISYNCLLLCMELLAPLLTVWSEDLNCAFEGYSCIHFSLVMHVCLLCMISMIDCATLESKTMEFFLYVASLETGCLDSSLFK